MTNHALGLALALDERGLHPATKVRVHLVAEVTAIAPGIERARPPLSVVLAVDTSGSMAGPPIEHVVQSIDRVVALLDPEDRVAVVAFSDNATEITSLLAAGPEARKLTSTRCHRLVAEGGTNMEAGLVKAASLLPPRGQHERQVILLLSDGAPNVGKASVDDLGALCRSFRPASVSTLGYGAQHNEDLLRGICEATGGRYRFISDPRVCEMEFAQAIGAQGDVVAEAVEILLVPGPGVEIVRFLGATRTRFGAGGVKIDVPDLLEGSRFLVAAEVELTPPREPGPWAPLRATLSYRRAGERETLEASEAIETGVGEGDRRVDPPVRASVLLARADEVRAEARALADRGQFEGAAAVLRRLIRAVEAEPWFVSNDGSRLAEAVEQLLDEAVAMERKPSQEEYKNFRKSQLGTSLSEAAPAGPPRSTMALAAVAGKLPQARLLVLNGSLAGRRFELVQPKVVVGRTSAADIPVTDGSVSRCHLMIAGQSGKFMAIDMGSTNTSMLNGERLTRPTPLNSGDVLQVGTVAIRYEEDPADRT